MISFTSLTGTIATNSNTLYPNSFTTLVGNNSPQNVALGKALINNQQRLLLEKYFDNERSFSILTIGAQNLTLTATPASGDTSATLTTAWPYASCTQNIQFSSSERRYATFIYNSTAVAWQLPLTQSATTAIVTDGVQDYNIPAFISKIKDDTISVGQLKFTPVFVQSRREWDVVTMVPYKADIPQYCFIWNGKLSIFPIPATTNNVITFNYKQRVPDMTFSDYTTGTITTMAPNTVAVTGSGTAWNSTGLYPLSKDLTQFNLMLQVAPPNGDGIWYPIYEFNSDTSLTLANPVISAPNISSASYTIAQMPLLQEDFHPMLVHGALRIYYHSIVKDEQRFQMYDALYKDELALLADYAGTKQVSVDLEEEIAMVNANLFLYANGTPVQP